MKITKILLSFLSLVAIGCAACSASSSKRSVDSVDSTSFDESESDTETQCIGMLKAFGLKGKVKTLTFSKDEENADSFTFSFDLKGNLLDYPDYNGGNAKKESESMPYFCEISIDDWRWDELFFSGRFTLETSYEMIKYDADNRPILANVYIDNNEAKKNVSISYSGSDEKGNYDKIHFDTKGININDSFVSLPYIIKTMNVKIEYWPDNATTSDIPTKLSENISSELIKKANIKDNSALSVDLKKVVDGDTGESTLINYGEFAYVPDIVVRVSEIHIGDSGDKASVVFYFAPIYDDGKYDESDLYDNEYLRLAEFVFENGKWKVDDIGWDLVYHSGLYFSGETYKEYERKYRI